MAEFLALIGAIARSYAEHHEPDVLDPDSHVWSWDDDGPVADETAGFFNYLLSGWWVLDDTQTAWNWWLCVYTRPPYGHDFLHFPYCHLDAPLTEADFSSLGFHSRSQALAIEVWED